MKWDCPLKLCCSFSALCSPMSSFCTLLICSPTLKLSVTLITEVCWLIAQQFSISTSGYFGKMRKGIWVKRSSGQNWPDIWQMVLGSLANRIFWQMGYFGKWDIFANRIFFVKRNLQLTFLFFNYSLRLKFLHVVKFDEWEIKFIRLMKAAIDFSIQLLFSFFSNLLPV